MRIGPAGLVADTAQTDECVAGELFVQKVGANLPSAVNLFKNVFWEIPEELVPEIGRHKDHVNGGVMADRELPGAGHVIQHLPAWRTTGRRLCGKCSKKARSARP